MTLVSFAERALLVDVLRKHESSAKSVHLHVRSAVARGEVWVADGLLQAVSTGDISGKPALFALLFEEARVIDQHAVPPDTRPMTPEALLSPMPITLLLKRFEQLRHQWEEHWRSGRFVASPDNPSASRLQSFFAVPIDAQAALAETRVGAVLEEFEHCLKSGVLLGETPPDEPPAQPPQPQETVREAPATPPAPVKAQAAAQILSTAAGLLLATDDAEPGDLFHALVRGANPGEEVVVVGLDEHRLLLANPSAPLVIDASRDPRRALACLRQVMLLAPRPVVWVYQDAGGAGTAVEAARFGARGMWRPGHPSIIDDWIESLRIPGSTPAVRRLRYVNSGPRSVATSNAFVAVLAGRTAMAPAIEALCNIHQDQTAAGVLLHHWPLDVEAALLRFLDRHSPFDVRQEIDGEGLQAGQLVVLHHDHRTTFRSRNQGFSSCTSIDDGTEDMWVSQMNLQIPNKLIVMTLGADIVLSKETATSLRSLLQWTHQGDRVAFETLAEQLGQQVQNVGVQG